MHINIIIGNPPYNNDSYIPFVEAGLKYAKDCSCFVTPAKWQAKGGDLNIHFRKNVVPYMQKIVYYKDTKDIFDIAEPDGIAYYIISSKNKLKERYVKNICTYNKAFDSDYELHTEENVVLLKNDVMNIIKKCNTGTILNRMLHNSVMDLDDYGEKVRGNHNVEIVWAEKGVCGYSNCAKLYESQINMYKAYVHCLVSQGSSRAFNNEGYAIGNGKKRTFIAKPGQVPQGNYFVLWLADTLDEIESFKSYMDSKLISFLYFVGITSCRDMLDNYRFIPDPIKLDHIFNDNELYARFNFTDNEIKIIESVIKN